MSCKWEHYGNKLSRYLIKLRQKPLEMHSVCVYSKIIEGGILKPDK